MAQALSTSLSEIAANRSSAARGETRTRHAALVVENMRCGGCMATVERTLQASPGVTSARANLSARRATVSYDPASTDVQRLVDALERAGYRAAESVEAADDADVGRADDLMRRLGVAGFAAANVMLLSEVVWFGAVTDMDQSTTDLFHWLSALFAMPATAYAAQPFFRSAVTALKARRLNMDVPISLGIMLALAMSLFHTIRGTDQVYFDAAIMLTFFLLIGRYLDELVRARARGAAENLLGLKSLAATVVNADGTTRRVAARALEPGMRILVAAGERIPADGTIDGTTQVSETEIDESLITGETLPRAASRGCFVHAGTVNLLRPITVSAVATNDNTLVAEIARLMQAAEQGRGQYVRLADRAARLYAPVVHILGAATFLGWMLAGAGWELSLTYAIAVLIITCPCALALAVPAVQVAAISRLFGKGIIVKAPDGLERLAEIDTVVFDKTGTLTRGEPSLRNVAAIDSTVLARAVSLAAASRHPYSQAIVRAARDLGLSIKAESDVAEVPGSGLAAHGVDGERRLGSLAWVAGACAKARGNATLWYAEPGMSPVGFEFDDPARSDARDVVGALGAAGFRVELLSGDRESAVSKAAEAADIGEWRGSARRDAKIVRLDELKAKGRSVLMVGDGLNDAPALAAAHASLSPSTAADISQNAADAVFQGEQLAPVIEVLAVARAARRMSLENFAIAIAYNVVSVPLAMAGYVTPLIAALAMSLSSIAVTANAVRLSARKVPLAPVEPKS